MLFLTDFATKDEFDEGDQHGQTEAGNQNVKTSGHVVQGERLLATFFRVRVFALGSIVPPLVFQSGQFSCWVGRTKKRSRIKKSSFQETATFAAWDGPQRTKNVSKAQKMWTRTWFGETEHDNVEWVWQRRIQRSGDAWFYKINNTFKDVKDMNKKWTKQNREFLSSIFFFCILRPKIISKILI